MKAEKLLIKMLKEELKSIGVKVSKLTDKDLETIAYEWIVNSRAYIEETIEEDIYENETINEIVVKRKAIKE
jgi:hypothetical protein